MRIMRRPFPGVALLMVVLVLAMLTIIGVLFSMTVAVHLQTNIQYREQSEAQNAGFIGLQRFMSELQYKVWGTNEMRAFTSADGTPLGVPLGTKVGEFSFGTYAGDPDDVDNPPVAYFKSRTDPAGESAVEKLTRPWSRYVQSVVTLDHGDTIKFLSEGKMVTLANIYARKCGGNENDYRWMISSDVWGGENAAIIGERMLDARLNDDGTPRAAEAGGLYHDEFLPTGLSNADCFELALHYNHGTIFGRKHNFGNRTAHGYSRLAVQGYRGHGYGDVNVTTWETHHYLGRNEYWGHVSGAAGKNPEKQVGYNSLNYIFDPIDPRMVGDSFYRIFRFDLVDPVDFKVRGTGVDPDKPSRYFSENEIYGHCSGDKFAKDSSGKRLIRATHLGSASSSPGDNIRSHKYDAGNYNDVLGDAVNLNQVNLNHPFELYTGPAGANKISPDEFFHYNESKWIYLYDRDDPELSAWGRYALMVWPDCGLLNVNAVNQTERWHWNTTDSGLINARTLRGQAMINSDNPHGSLVNYLAALDHGLGESGGWKTDSIGTYSAFPDNATKEGLVGFTADPLVRVMGQLAFGVSGETQASTKPTDYGALISQAWSRLDEHKWRAGPFGSRAEVETILRKRVFKDSDSALEARILIDSAFQKTLGGKSLKELTAGDLRLHDAELIANYVTPHSFEYLLDPHWEHDRLIFDGEAGEDWHLKALFRNTTALRGRYGGSGNTVKPHLAPSTPGGFFGVTTDGGAVRTRERMGDILGSLKNFYGPHSVPIDGGALDAEAQPGMPLPPFSSDYAETKKHLGSHTYIGPYQAKKSKTMLLSTLLNAMHHGNISGVNAYATYWSSFAVDLDNLAAAPLVNATPKDILFSGKRYVLERANTLRITEVGSGLFTVPIGPKMPDPDFDEPHKRRLLISRVDRDLKPDWSWNTTTNHCMIPNCDDFDHRYGFETKWMNFIELSLTTPSASLNSNWFLRVYGNVRNWQGKCVDEDGNETDAKRVEDGGTGYVDLFAKVKTKKTAVGLDANNDGDFLDPGDTPPQYKIDENYKGWMGSVFYDPDHYIEGVVLRYFSSAMEGSRDLADSAGWFLRDTNGDGMKTYDRDWKTDFKTKADGQPDDYWNDPFMKPNIPSLEDLQAGTYVTCSAKYVPDKDDDPKAGVFKGKYYSTRGGTDRLINPNGVVGDNIPDEDWGRPDTLPPDSAGNEVNNGSKEPDGKIDGVAGYYDQKNVAFWETTGKTYFVENIADWLTAGKYYFEEDVDLEKIDDTFSGRDWSQISLGRASGGGTAVYRFGSYTPFFSYENAYNSGVPTGHIIDWMRNEVKLSDPHSGLEHLFAPEQQPYSYILVVFPHARTPWTRRAEDPDKHYGVGHFDDKDKYPDVTDATPRRSNYADGDAVMVGYFTEDSYKRYALNRPQAEYENQPRAINWVRLNGQHPDYAKAEKSAGPACAFQRMKACLSGGSFIVDAGGGIVKEDAEEALPGGRKQTIPSEVGRGYSCRDLRDNCDPWTWDATGWDWNEKCSPKLDGDPFAQPYKLIQQTPALTSYDERYVPPHVSNYPVRMWERPDPGTVPGRGRISEHVHGRNANSIYHQLDQGDPTAEDPSVVDVKPNSQLNGPVIFSYPRLRLPADYVDHDFDGQPDVTVAAASGIGAEAGKGRFPYPLSCQTNARPSKSSAATIMDDQLNGWLYKSSSTECPTFFRDRLWMKYAALGTGDLRVRGWGDIVHYSRADEYFDSDCMSPAWNFFAPAFSPIRDLLDNNLTGVPEGGASDIANKRGYTEKPLWNKRWKDGAFQDFSERGRYWADRKVVKRTNLNEIVVPAVARYFLHRANGTNASPVIISLMGHKPPRGYPYVNNWRQRVTTTRGIRFNALWRDNLWADASMELAHIGNPNWGQEAINPLSSENGWASETTVAPSPVYTAFVLAQKLNVDGQPICEEKYRVTLERTWDGKIQVVEYRVTPQD